MLNLENENWVEIPFDTNYLISDLGRVKSKSRQVICGRNKAGTRNISGKVLTPFVVKSTGYMQVSLSNHKRYSVHRLVLESFIGKPSEGQICAHFDGVRSNNKLSNLRWATYSENCSDTERHGRHAIGARNKQSVLKEGDIPKIRADKRSRVAIAKDYGVTPEAISHVILRKNWNWVR